MAFSECKARAIYEFVAETPAELSFTANEILIVTSTSAEDPWWSARNSSGQTGSIPSNYVEIIYDEEESKQQTSTFQDINFNYTPIDNANTYLQPTSEVTYQPQMQQEQIQNTNLTSINDWTTEPTSQVYEEPVQSNNQVINTDTSFNSLVSATTNDNTSNLIPVISVPSDPYIAVTDIPIMRDSSLLTSRNSVQQNVAMSYQHDSWYFDSTNASTPILSTNSSIQHDLTPSFGYSQTTVAETKHEQQVSTFDDFMFSSQEPQYAVAYNMPSQVSQSAVTNNAPSQLMSSYQPETMMPQTMHNKSSVPIENSNLSKYPTTKTLSESKSEEAATSAPPTTNTKKKFFTLRREKPKREREKGHSLSETSLESSLRQGNDETNSLSSNASGSTLHNTLLNPSKAPIGEGDAKGSAPRARFFDKHGIDNYLLHGCKVKSDEHVQIGYDEKEGGVYWIYNPTMPPFTCKVEDPEKGTKLGGFKTFMEYKIHTQISGSRVVGRRYKQFDWLHEQLVNKFRFICIPPLPEKQIAGRFDQEFVEERRRQLELWLNRVCRHPVLCASFPVQHFVTCELTDGNNKDWKAGKRRSEKDELREASWLQCVSFTNSNLSDADIVSYIDAFTQQQPNLEMQLKNLTQGLVKYLERHTEIYERDIQRIGELFAKFQKVLQLDTTTFGSNKELSDSTWKISTSYNSIAELYKTKACEGIRDFNERAQEYIGLLACFPLILSIQRCGSDFIRNIQQRGPSTVSDFNSVINRAQVLNHVVLAEINFFQKEKVKDLNLYMKTLMNEQILFYEQITSELRDAAMTFN
ncbi:unnamed protein product [Rotaria sp. Silwood2]|nr:unnamed protein product [Rotaria sp. Silwood2]CAF2661013.1 unnamed protein product [Rotaria sp. Silwood2]CAF4231887.1 unnamed protein product [Rotaria sp. Silwood2]CAF4303067.1 unnamed protein product [Rotaria sp. Silwood2]